MNTQCKETAFDHFVWIDILRPDKGELDKIAQTYNLDYFLVTDSLEAGHLPKFEQLKKYNFLILRGFMANINQRITTVNELSNKIAFFYNDKKIITVHRADFDFLKGDFSHFKSTEALLLHFVSQLTETYFEPYYQLSDKNDELERIIFLKDYTKVSLEDLYFQKTETRLTKKLLQISQSVIGQINVNEASATALQDVKDKLLNLILGYDELLENSNNLLNTHMSVNAQKSNDVMKLLTIFSAFFLPLTFIAGIYGMNFENMPELRLPGGYFATLAVMVVIAVVIYFWFKRKKIL